MTRCQTDARIAQLFFRVFLVSLVLAAAVMWAGWGWV